MTSYLTPCHRCDSLIGEAGKPVLMASSLGNGKFCNNCFDFLFKELREKEKTHKTSIRQQRSSIAKSQWGKRRSVMPKFIVSCEVDSGDELIELAALLSTKFSKKDLNTLVARAYQNSGGTVAAKPDPAASKKAAKKAPEPEEVCGDAQEAEDDEEDEDEESDDGNEKDEESDDDEEPKPATKKGKAGKLEASPALRNAGKLREVIQILTTGEYNIKSKSELIAACERLKNDVTVLKMIQDLPSRMDKVLEMLALDLSD